MGVLWRAGAHVGRLFCLSWAILVQCKVTDLPDCPPRHDCASFCTMLLHSRLHLDVSWLGSLGRLSCPGGYHKHVAVLFVQSFSRA